MEPTLFGVELFKVEVPLIEIATVQINMDFTDLSWIRVAERIFQDRCDKVKKETKVNWSKEGF